MIFLLFRFFFYHFSEQLFGLVRYRLITNMEIRALSLFILVQGLTFISFDELFDGRILAQFLLVSKIIYHLNIAFLLQQLLFLRLLFVFVLVD